MIPEAAYNRYLASLLEGNRGGCRRIVEELLALGVPVRELYRDLFHESLYEVGRLWESGQATVAVEHMATAITESLIALVFPTAIARPPIGRRAVVSCAADEFHQIGGRIIADILELRGWNVGFVGANLPITVLLSTVARQQPDLVGISITIVDHLDNGQRAVEEIRRAGWHMPILLGGGAIRALPGDWLSAQRGVHLVRSIDELEAFLPALEPA